ncbi:MAG: hypothetical protein V4574_16740 [Pseudomonadota bacterium]
MMIAPYQSKKQLAQCIGEPLRYVETSIFGPEYTDDGTFVVSNRPSLPQGAKRDPSDPNGRTPREFFAEVTMKDGKIATVK